MKQKSEKKPLGWAELRFSVIGSLLAIGPEEATLAEAFAKLARRAYPHPRTGNEIGFSASTIERWYYQALGSKDALKALGRQRRQDHGQTRRITPALSEALARQYRCYPHWSYQLNCDNLAALAEERSELGKAPSYTTLRRYMQQRGWTKKQKPGTLLFRPVLLVGEAQELNAVCLNENRLLGSAQFDSQCLLTTLLCGDTRLP